MKIIFYGTPDFAVQTLRRLYESDHEIIGVVTIPDKEQGRGLKLKESPVKTFALENNLQLFQPANLKSEEFLESMRILNPDVGIIVAFKILPRNLFSVPKFGTFNLHGSLLPKYRGAAPIQWSLINGDQQTGLTTFFLEEKVDTGNIILQQKIDIDNLDDFEKLHNKMSEIGAELVIQSLNKIIQKDFVPMRQNDFNASPAPKITREICHINWNNTAQSIRNLMRGLSPFPGAFSVLDKKQIKFFKSELTNLPSDKLPGFIEVDTDLILINCNDFKLSIIQLQLEGRKKMTVKEFISGYRTLIADALLS